MLIKCVLPFVPSNTSNSFTPYEQTVLRTITLSLKRINIQYL